MHGRGLGRAASQDRELILQINRSRRVGKARGLAIAVMGLLAATSYLFGGVVTAHATTSAITPHIVVGSAPSVGTTQTTAAATLAKATAPVVAAHVSLTPNGLSTRGKAFTYGFDLAQAGPYDSSGPAINSARRVAQSVNGPIEDIPIMGWGLPNPEPSPGTYDFTEIARRIAFIQSTGGTPVITLCAAPDWMKGGQSGTTDWSQIDTAPLPPYYPAFAALSAAVARTFPQVKYFVVWNEMKGFWDASADQWNAASYTALYNDVYSSIKAVRPDALVGGPYVSMQSDAGTAQGVGAVSGPWGHLDPASLSAVSYWLAHNVGADFFAADGRGFTDNDGLVTDPLSATQKFAAVDNWLRTQTPLPIVWMESPLLPDPGAETQAQQAALRVGALIEMAASGASVGMQWNPEQTQGWDEGLWTATDVVGGGQATILGQELPGVLAVLAAPVALASGEPPGTMMATGPDGTIQVTLTPTSGSVVTRVS